MSFQEKFIQHDKDKCEFFGFLGIVNQLILGVLTFSFLIIKRFIEKPRRHWFIWFFDVLKQIPCFLNNPNQTREKGAIFIGGNY